MIKCPNCGSTAQVKCTYFDEEKYASTHYREFKCGCGCEFLITFEIKKIEIKKIEIKKKKEG